MKYLLFPSVVAAQLRSAAAYVAPEESETLALWGWTEHPTDGRAALIISDTPEGAGMGMSQAEYDALLTTAERAELVAELPADWFPEQA